ncbi:MAG: hypothetical protein J6B81_04330 [Spirochaetaceae bacterium]|nr:hypothetical protein [Spirochaetaceae bacterium]
MTQKKLIIILSFTCTFLLLVYVLSFFSPNGNLNKNITSALVNPKYIEQIVFCRITSPSGNIEFSKESGLWIGRQKDTVFPVAEGFMDSFLKSVCEVRELYIVAENPTEKQLESFNLSYNQSVQVDYMLADKTMCSSLSFGGNNYSGQRIYFYAKPTSFATIDSSVVVYETKDDIFPWLNSSAKHWADMNLIPQTLLGNAKESDIQYLVVSYSKSDFSILPSQNGFFEIVSKLFSLRGGSILPLSATEGAELEATISLETGTGGIATLQLLKKIDETETLFFVVPQITPGVENKAVSSAASACSYSLEISQWTYNALLEEIKPLAY